MSGLRSALEELQEQSLGETSDPTLEQDLAELERASRVLEAERLRRVAELDRRRSFRREGYLSTAAWLTDRLGLSWNAAADQVRTARSLEQMPRTLEALGQGEVPTSSMRILAGAREAHPDEFRAAEPDLVQAARTLPPKEVQHAAMAWRQRVDLRKAAQDEQRLRERRRLHVSRCLSGLVRIEGELDRETGETVINALRAVEDAEARRGGDDLRTHAQRRADAPARSAGSGWTSPTDPRWPASALT